ncbi:PREDICTED: F-box/kelch-repeat protein At5g51250-like [Camelina sativa]|uniref:F-box/kelch-repeat protein At5g51250-like n=1 Tax=Camelina sativa TaxID=90675 RepID=A0ABM0XEL8_CAMSA|nr:PREDICTED: F-box/kelch-repeat protein At5g51250-like [Camelina sativa]
MELLSSINGKRKRMATTTTTPAAKKKKKPSTTPIPTLPDNVILNIIARVSRVYYPTLSVVSKSFRSLMTSPELCKTRSRLGRTESCPYVCFRAHTGFTWFTLCRKPDQTLTNQKSKSGYALVKVPIPHSPDAFFSNLVAVGSDIYNIGVSESKFKASSSTVCVLDCTTHTWREAPRLPVELFRLSVSATFLDGKVYVAGYSLDGDKDSDPLKNSLEVFDTRTQVWDPNPIPCSVANAKEPCYKGASVDGKFHVMAGSKVFAYNAKEGRWDRVRPGMSTCVSSDSHCEIGNVLYSACKNGVFRWFDTQVGIWRELKGLVGLPKFPPDARVILGDYDGKIAAFWPEISSDGFPHKFMIWCAEIALERRTSCEIWGKVEWFDHVLSVPVTHTLVKAVAATV